MTRLKSLKSINIHQNFMIFNIFCLIDVMVGNMSSEAKQQSLPVVSIPGKHYRVAERFIDGSILNEQELNLITNAGNYIGLVETIGVCDKKHHKTLIWNATTYLNDHHIDSSNVYTIEDYTWLLECCKSETIDRVYQQIQNEKNNSKIKIKENLVSEANLLYLELKEFAKHHEIRKSVREKSLKIIERHHKLY